MIQMSTLPLIVAITETWLKPKITDSFVLSSRSSAYSLYRADRKCKKGGGVALFILSTADVRVVLSCSSKNAYELLVADIEINGDLVRLFVVYRTPTCSLTDTTLLAKHMSDLSTCAQPSLILGDFNLPDIEWFTSPSPTFSLSVSRAIVEFCTQSQFTQLTNTPTRENTILDLVLTNTPGLVSDLVVIPPIGQSDHAGVSFSLAIEHSFPAFSYVQQQLRL